ncbi:hypothetical protein GF420_02200, partial [candidate division GN15 bacterium]|nr:hypothetical protein [candidate division GN15 bacterium]
MRRLMIALVLAILVAPVTGLAIGSADLYAAYEQMQQVPAQPAEVIELADYTLERHDFAFRIESGRFFFFEPLDINGARHDWGGLFVGKGLFQFEPQLPMERNQMQLFFESDSLNRECEYAVMLFNDTVAAWLREAGTPVEDAPAVWDEDARDELETLHAHLTRNENKAYLFEALRNVTFPLRRPFLLVDADLDDATEVFYIFNPAQREEVSLLKDYKEFFVSFFMETVCNYSVYADRTYRKINGINRERIKTSHYTIN